MKIQKLVERLLIFFVGMPLILISIYFLPHYNFFLYHIEVFIAALIANYEIYNILSQKSPTYPKKNFCSLRNHITCNIISHRFIFAPSILYTHFIRLCYSIHVVYGNYLFIFREFYQ